MCRRKNFCVSLSHSLITDDCLLAHAVPYTPGNLTLTYAPNDQPGQLGPTEKFTARAEDLGLRYFDFRFLGEPQQCSDKDACEEFKRDFLWDKYMPEEEQNQYKYVMDVDGNGWSGRLHR